MIWIVEPSASARRKLAEAFRQAGWPAMAAAEWDELLRTPRRAFPSIVVTRNTEVQQVLRQLPGGLRDRVSVLSLGEASGVDASLPEASPTREVVSCAAALLRGGDELTEVESRVRGARILIVDDSYTFRAMVREALEEAGLRVDACETAGQALEYLWSEPFDAVLLDLGLPDMNGIELCRLLNPLRLAPRDPLGVLIITAREDDDALSQALEAGADDFVTKSGDLSALLTRLTALVRRRAYLRAMVQARHRQREKELEAYRADAARLAVEVRSAAELARAYEELRNAQAQLVHSEKMASLGQLVAGIAHEMNTPLAFVLQNLDNVSRWLDKLQAMPGEAELWQKVRSRLKLTDQGARRVHELVEKLRTFSRLDQGELEPWRCGKAWTSPCRCWVTVWRASGWRSSWTRRWLAWAASWDSSTRC
ncbi:MAG: response regulator [Candidatus Eremiobacterota bacterium]